MHVPGLFEPIPRIPSLVSMTAEISAESSFLGKEVQQVEASIDARLVMVERPDSDGEMKSVHESEIGNLQSGDRIYLILEIDDVGKVEDSLRS